MLVTGQWAVHAELWGGLRGLWSCRRLAVCAVGCAGLPVCTRPCHPCGLVCVHVWHEMASILRRGCSKVGLPGSLTHISGEAGENLSDWWSEGFLQGDWGRPHLSVCKVALILRSSAVLNPRGCPPPNAWHGSV